MRNGFLFVQITRCSNFAFWPRILQSIIFLRGRVLGNIFLYKIISEALFLNPRELYTMSKSLVTVFSLYKLLDAVILLFGREYCSQLYF